MALLRARHAGATVALALAVAVLAAGPREARAQEPAVNQAELVRHLLPSVVGIIAHARPEADTSSMMVSSAGESDSFEYKSSAGSGFVVDPGGTIMTNWHVVAGAYEIFVTFPDGKRYDAEVLNAARLIDLALLKIKPDAPLQAVTWGDQGTVHVGDSVLAIGNPLGIGITVTRGIVSALHRNISDTPYDDFIQTDAAINHGNSGGPLFNLKGEVIGVDSAIISPTAANAGLGFALPADQARFVLDQLTRYGWVRPGWLGVKIQDVTYDMAKAIGLPQARGSIVAWLTAGGPAEKAGLRIGDVITQFNDEEAKDERDLLRKIAGSPPGRIVNFGLIRDGKPLQVSVTLSEWPRMQWEQLSAPLKVAPPHWTIPADLGIKAVELTDQLRAENNIPAGRPGALVLDVRHGTDAARRGLTPGDVIMQVGDAVVDGPAKLMEQIDAARKAGHDLANFLILPKDKGRSAFPSPKWLPLRVSAG